MKVLPWKKLLAFGVSVLLGYAFATSVEGGPSPVPAALTDAVR
jgi:hypothetical protein